MLLLSFPPKCIVVEKDSTLTHTGQCRTDLLQCIYGLHMAISSYIGTFQNYMVLLKCTQILCLTTLRAKSGLKLAFLINIFTVDAYYFGIRPYFALKHH